MVGNSSLPISSSFISLTLARKSFSTPSTSSWHWQAAYFSKRFLFSSINVFPHLNFLRRMVARSGNPSTENRGSLVFSRRYQPAHRFLSSAPHSLSLQHWGVHQLFFFYYCLGIQISSNYFTLTWTANQIEEKCSLPVWHENISYS